jgi:hypothetical protein
MLYNETITQDLIIFFNFCYGDFHSSSKYKKRQHLRRSIYSRDFTRDLVTLFFCKLSHSRFEHVTLYLF